MKKSVSFHAALGLLLSAALLPAVAQTTTPPSPVCINPVCVPKRPCPQIQCPITKLVTEGRFHFNY